MPGGDILGIAGLTPGGVGIWTGVLLLIGKWLVERGKLRKIDRDADGTLITTLMKRVSDLETALTKQVADCAEESRQLRAEIEGLHRQLVQFQVTTGMAMPLSARSVAVDGALASLKGIAA